MSKVIDSLTWSGYSRSFWAAHVWLVWCCCWPCHQAHPWMSADCHALKRSWHFPLHSPQCCGPHPAPRSGLPDWYPSGENGDWKQKRKSGGEGVINELNSTYDLVLCWELNSFSCSIPFFPNLSTFSSKLYSHSLWSLGPAGSYMGRRRWRLPAEVHGQRSRSRTGAVCQVRPGPRCPRLYWVHGPAVVCSDPASSGHHGSSGMTCPVMRDRSDKQRELNQGIKLPLYEGLEINPSKSSAFDA